MGRSAVDIIQYALLGLGTGAIYAMLAQGLVLVYRGSGLLNFSQGALALLGAGIYYQLSVEWHQPVIEGVIAAILICALVGLAIHVAVLRPMRHSAVLTRVIATLGITMILQSLAYLRFGHDLYEVPAILPSGTLHLGSQQLAIGWDRIIIFAIGLILTIALAVIYKRTSFGRATTAVAENQLHAAILGHSPGLIAGANWALGAALAGLAGVLIAPIIFIDPGTFVLLIVPAMVGALIGQFGSFFVTFCVCIALGIAESEVGHYVTQPGWGEAAPFIALVPVLMLRGRALPLRSFVLDRMPSVGSGRVRIIPVVVVTVAAACLLIALNATWVSAIATTLAIAIICLSVVLLTGYAGQLSLAQGVLAGVAALLAAHFATSVPFLAALVLGVAVTAVGGVLLSVMALRTRGMTLAVATLGMGSAVSDVLLNSPTYSGGISGIMVKTPSLFGLDLDPFAHTSRYGILVLVVFVLWAIGLANLRRGAVGRRLLSVRSNERAAAAAGISVTGIKVYVFVLAAIIAGTGGVLLAFIQPIVAVEQIDSFTVFDCLVFVVVVVVGGLGYVGGALLGSTLVAGGIVTQIFNAWPVVNDYLPLIGGLNLLLVLIFNANGLFEVNQQALSAIGRNLIGLLPDKLRRAGRRRAQRPAYSVVDGAGHFPVRPMSVQVSDLCVSFGGVRAVRNVNLEISPGEIHGLIGPNGAGKTTIIDAITGFVAAQSGSIMADGRDMANRSPQKIFRTGIVRSFQSLELFDDLTVLENIAVPSEEPRRRKYVSDMFHPGRQGLTRGAVAAIEQLELADVLDKRPLEISFGLRKVVAIARSVASIPSVLLLDEPAAGLGDHEAAELAELIVMLAQKWGIGVLLVEHRIDMVMSICDKVTVLRAGEVLTSGAPAEVRRNQAVIDAYLGESESEAAVVGES
jgi:ABC-type branched-subunit amino acid transport system ATPase component/branched-subunit amino acid ABC-type transport system permease component